MSDRRNLYKAILADPADDLARLVYADWLEENGRQNRADFIRWGVEHPEIEWGYDIFSDGTWSFRYAMHSQNPVPDVIVDELNLIAKACAARAKCHSNKTQLPKCITAISRGFVSKIKGDLRSVVLIGPALASIQPIEHVFINDISFFPRDLPAEEESTLNCQVNIPRSFCAAFIPHLVRQPGAVPWSDTTVLFEGMEAAGKAIDGASLEMVRDLAKAGGYIAPVRKLTAISSDTPRGPEWDER